MGDLVGKWNYYFLRYGAGTVVGAVIVVFLGNLDGNCYIKHLLHKICAGEIAPITALVALGFAYCYIASAPVLVFHATRGLFWRKSKKCSCPFWFVVIFAYGLIVFLLFNEKYDWSVWGAAIALFVFLLQVVLLIVAFFEFKTIRVFYRLLAHGRSKKPGKKSDPNNVGEYVESYQHLREHGNAFEIIFLELVLAATLVFLKNFYPVVIAFYPVVIAFYPVVIALWVLPAALCWLVGTRLEFQIPKLISAKKPSALLLIACLLLTVSVGLRAQSSGGTVVAWGRNGEGQTTIPAGLSGVTAIAGGYNHTVALKNDGTVVAWGDNSYGQTNVPVGLSNVMAIAAGQFYTVVLKTNGTVVAWGDNSYGQTNVPVGLSGVKAIAGGYNHTVALKNDGKVVAWGDPVEGQTTVPTGLSNVIAIAAGASHTVALKSNGSVVAWGSNLENQTNMIHPTSLYLDSWRPSNLRIKNSSSR